MNNDTPIVVDHGPHVAGFWAGANDRDIRAGHDHPPHTRPADRHLQVTGLGKTATQYRRYGVRIAAGQIAGFVVIVNQAMVARLLVLWNCQVDNRSTVSVEW